MDGSAHWSVIGAAAGLGTGGGIALAALVSMWTPEPPPPVILPPPRCEQIALPPLLAAPVEARVRDFEVLQRRLETGVGRPMPWDEIDAPDELLPDNLEARLKELLEPLDGEIIAMDCAEYPCVVTFEHGVHEGDTGVAWLGSDPLEGTELEDLTCKGTWDEDEERKRIRVHTTFAAPEHWQDPRAQGRISARLDRLARQHRLAP